MLEHVDLAFNVKFLDPDEEYLFDHLEIRDAFLEFMSSIMADYTRYIIDPSEQPDIIVSSKDFFDMDRFRLHKDAKKPF